MGKTIFILAILFVFTTAQIDEEIYDKDFYCNSCTLNEIEYLRPNPMRVSGIAVAKIPAEVVVIDFTVGTQNLYSKH